MLKLITNKIRCKFCGDIIESRSVHDFVRCRCGKCSTDGGREYAQRSFVTENPEDTFEDMSTYVNTETGEIISAKSAAKEDIPLKPIRVEIKKVEEPEDPSKDVPIYEKNGWVYETTVPTLDIPIVTEAEETEPAPVPVLETEKIVKRDKNGKPISGRYPYGKKN